MQTSCISAHRPTCSKQSNRTLAQKRMQQNRFRNACPEEGLLLNLDIYIILWYL